MILHLSRPGRLNGSKVDILKNTVYKPLIMSINLTEHFGFAIVVDDKTTARQWNVEALRQAGFSKDSIIPTFYGDEAWSKYRDLLEKGNEVGIILSDEHMDVTHKPPQDYPIHRSFKNAAILSGIALARTVFSKSPAQKFCLSSRGLNYKMREEAEKAGIKLILYKRRPEEKKFSQYVETIKHYVMGTKNHVDLEQLTPEFCKK